MTDAKQPAFIVYAVTDKEGAEKNYWTRLDVRLFFRNFGVNSLLKSGMYNAL